MFSFPEPRPSSPLSIGAPTFVPAFNAMRANSGGGSSGAKVDVPQVSTRPAAGSNATGQGVALNPSMYRTFHNSNVPGSAVFTAHAGGLGVNPGGFQQQQHPKRGKAKGRDTKVGCGICGGEYDGASPFQVVMHIGGRPHRVALAEACSGAATCGPGCACKEQCRSIDGPHGRRGDRSRRRQPDEGTRQAAAARPADDVDVDAGTAVSELGQMVNRLMEDREQQRGKLPALVTALLECPAHAAAHTSAGYDVAGLLAGIASGAALGRDDGAEAEAMKLEPDPDWLVQTGRSYVGWRTRGPYKGTRSLRSAVPVDDVR